MRRPAAALAALALTALVAVGVAAAIDRAGHAAQRRPGPPPKVFAFVSSVGGRELTRLERMGLRIDVIAPNWYGLDVATGDVRAPDPRSAARLRQAALDRGVRVWPTVNALTGGSRSWESPQARERIARALLAVALEDGATGATLDMEELRPRQRELFTALVARAAKLLHARNRRLAVYVPRMGPGTAAAYDWKALGARADLVLTSGYNEHWSGSRPGPITTTRGFRHVVDRGLELVGPRKAVPVIGAFGYRWPAAGPGALISTVEAERLRRSAGARAGRSDGAARFRAHGDTVVYETAAGMRSRARTARARGARWIGLFSLGREPVGFWDGLKTHRRLPRTGEGSPG